MQDQIGVLHLTMATFKPWDWWATWLLPEQASRWRVGMETLFAFCNLLYKTVVWPLLQPTVVIYGCSLVCPVQELRSHLPQAANGLLQGETMRQVTARTLLVPLPWILALLLIQQCWKHGLGSDLAGGAQRLRWHLQRRRNRMHFVVADESPAPASSPGSLPFLLYCMAILVGIGSGALALWISVGLVIPAQVRKCT